MTQNMIPLRMLWFESHAIAISDMKARVERTSSDTPRQMPLAERMSRLKRQKEELKGLQIDCFFRTFSFFGRQGTGYGG